METVLPEKFYQTWYLLGKQGARFSIKKQKNSLIFDTTKHIPPFWTAGYFKLFIKPACTGWLVEPQALVRALPEHLFRSVYQNEHASPVFPFVRWICAGYHRSKSVNFCRHFSSCGRFIRTALYPQNTAYSGLFALLIHEIFGTKIANKINQREFGF